MLQTQHTPLIHLLGADAQQELAPGPASGFESKDNLAREAPMFSRGTAGFASRTERFPSDDFNRTCDFRVGPGRCVGPSLVLRLGPSPCVHRRERRRGERWFWDSTL